MMGDFNEVVDESEKLGGRAIWNRKMYLRKFIHNVGAVDLGFEGNKYTWIMVIWGTLSSRNVWTEE